MKLNIRLLAAFFMLFMGFCAYAQQQEQPDILQQAEDEADRLQRLLDLEDWQTFYVDSTLKHDFPAMVAEMDKLRDSKVSNMMLYQAVQDKWWEQIDATYKRIFPIIAIGVCCKVILAIRKINANICVAVLALP